MIKYVEVAKTARGKWIVISDEVEIDTEDFVSNIIERIDKGIYRVNLVRIDEITNEEYFEDAYCKIIE